MAWTYACGRIESAKQGTGYLISSRRMVTCQHVVGDASEVTVRIGGGEYKGKVGQQDKDLDVAVVDFDADIAGAAPLTFAESCRQKATWETLGYPGMARGLGIPMIGQVMSAEAKDALGQASLVLYSDQIRSEGPTVSGFSGSPVIVNGKVAGTFKRIVENPDRKGWPLYGLVWATPASVISRFLNLAAAETVGEPGQADPVEGVLRELKSIVGARGVYELWKTFQASGIVDDRVSKAAAKSLIAKGRPELAHEVAEAVRDDVDSRVLRARALDELGRTDQAIQLLEQLEREGKLDSDGGGILAGRYRKMWESTPEDAWRTKSFKAYEKYWKAGKKDDASGKVRRDTYCGVNAAAMALQEGNEDLASTIARNVLDQMKKMPEADLTEWELATMAEAWLLRRNVKEAEAWYRKAKGAAAGNDHSIAVMWKGAVRAAEKLGLPTKPIDDLLRPRAVVGFLGHDIDGPDRGVPRFPSSRVKEVRAAVQEAIRQRRVGYGVSSACRGSDLIFLHALIESGGGATVVLTNPRDEFADKYVKRVWTPIFNEVLDSGRVELRVVDDSDQPWDDGLHILRSEVRKQAMTLRCDPLLMVVWDGSPGWVGDAVQLWEASSYPVEKITL